MNTTATSLRRRVVAVGVDASPQALSAARYAAAFADRNLWDLWLISTYQASPVPAATVASSLHSARAEAAAALQTTLDTVRIGPRVRLRTLVQQGPLNEALGALSHEVQLLVLGQHHLDLTDQLREGDHDAAIMAHAGCPVTVVPAAWDERRTPHHPIIVALDGETDAHAALALAFDDAAERHASIVVLHVPVALRTPETDIEITAGLAEIIAGAKQDYPDVPVRISLVNGPVEQVIIDESHGASVVILGRPHHAHLASWHFSVARRVLGEVGCPVTVVAAVPSRSRSGSQRAGGVTGEPLRV